MRKRNRIEFEAGVEKKDEFLRNAHKILNRMRNKDKMGVFSHPVDIVRDGCPDYYEVFFFYFMNY